eukprot:350783-Chlamydomonas_euryale.AAC.4
MWSKCPSGSGSFGSHQPQQHFAACTFHGLAASLPQSLPPSVRPSIHPSIRLSVRPSVRPFIHPSIQLDTALDRATCARPHRAKVVENRTTCPKGRATPVGARSLACLPPGFRHILPQELTPRLSSFPLFPFSPLPQALLVARRGAVPEAGVVALGPCRGRQHRHERHVHRGAAAVCAGRLHRPVGARDGDAAAVAGALHARHVPLPAAAVAAQLWRAAVFAPDRLARLDCVRALGRVVGGVHMRVLPEQQAPGGPPSEGRLTPSQPSLELVRLDSADVATAAAGGDGSGGGKPGGAGVRARDMRQRDTAAMRTTMLGRHMQRSDADADPALPISSAASAEPALLLARSAGSGGSPGGGAPWALPLHDDSDDPWSANLASTEQRVYGDAAFRWSGTPWNGAAAGPTEDSGSGGSNGAHRAADAAAGAATDATPGDVEGMLWVGSSLAPGVSSPAGRTAGAQRGGDASVGLLTPPLAAAWRSASPATAPHHDLPGHSGAWSTQGSAPAMAVPEATVADDRSAGGGVPSTASGVGAIVEARASDRQAEPDGAPAAAGLRGVMEASAAMPAAGAPVPSAVGLMPPPVDHGGSSVAAIDGDRAHSQDVPALPDN